MVKKHTKKTSKQQKKNKRTWAYIVAAIAAIVAIVIVMMLLTQKTTSKATYFSYSTDEIAKLKKYKTSEEFSTDDIYQWDQKYFRLVESAKLNDVEASRVYAYLAVAEADFAALSYSTTGKYSGNISIVAVDVACQFFANKCSSLSTVDQPDELSKQISSLVLSRVKTRMAEDKQMTKPLSIKKDSELWQGPDPKVGIDAATRKPWHLTSGKQFRVAPPPKITSKSYVTMLAEVNHALANITKTQRQAVVFWAGGPGTKTPPGIWLNLADQYMKDQNTDLSTVIDARSDVTTAMADAVIAVFDSKYTYQQKRPNMVDTSINTVMPTPNHPSYPAGHATISASAYAVLTHYFPTHKATWKQKADEASTSRLWGGIHFPIDNTAGFELGEKVGNQALTDTK